MEIRIGRVSDEAGEEGLRERVQQLLQMQSSVRYGEGTSPAAFREP